MKQRDWVQLTGDPETVGHALGLWWATQHPEAYDSETAWSDRLRPLLASTALYFPEVLEEISGMTRGAIAGGIATSFLDMFAQALGETTTKGSSVLVQSARGWILGHDEQGEQKVPLCFSRVDSGKLPFMSVSRPFQLLGSACGANSRLSMQGNAMGFAGHATQLEETWAHRVPKTVFSRKMLEATSIEDIVNLYSKVHTTLPSHHFICGNDSAYSCEVRPALDTNASPRQQLSFRRVTAPVENHTNQFMTRKGADRDWMWPKDGGNRDSDERRDDIKERVEATYDHDVTSVSELLRAHAEKYEEMTLASICFDTHREGVVCRAVDRTGKDHHEMGSLEL